MLDTILARIVSNDELHARWLNTLSYMEYVGARKMMKSQQESDIDEVMLEHMAEEIRHALILKKIVRRNFSEDLADYSEANMLHKPAAKLYFQRIDSMSGEQTKSARHAYLLTSYLIETRALKFYSAYDKQLKMDSSFRLVAIINQETRHLSAIENALVSSDKEFLANQDFLLKYEEQCFGEWLSSLAQEVEKYDTRTC